MPTREFKRRAVAVSAFLAPLAIVKMTSLFIGGPSEVDAGAQVATATQITANVAVSGPTWSEAAIAAARHSAELDAQPMANSPFFSEAPATQTTTNDGNPDAVEETPPCELQALMTSHNETLALIDGKLVRVGDRIGESALIVIEISSESRSVVLRHEETGEEHTITVRTRG